MTSELFLDIKGFFELLKSGELLKLVFFILEMVQKYRIG